MKNLESSGSVSGPSGQQAIGEKIRPENHELSPDDLGRVRRCLDEIPNALRLCRSRLVCELHHQDGEVVWLDPADGGPPYLGTYGSAAALRALWLIDGHSTELTQALQSQLVKRQFEEGGWSIRNALPVALTTAAAFSVQALHSTEPNSQTEISIAKGIEWLFRTRSRTGWGDFEGGAVTTNATLIAVTSLWGARATIPHRYAAILDAQCRSLFDLFDRRGFCPTRHDAQTGSVPLTARALLLLARLGISRREPVIDRALSWLLTRTFLSDDASDSFYIHKPDKSAAAVNFVHFTPAIVLQALLALEDRSLYGHATNLVEHLLRTQQSNGQWTSPLAPNQTPSWMLCDAVEGLRAYRSALSGDLVAWQSSKTTASAAALAIRVNELDQQVAVLAQRMSSIDRQIKPLADLSRPLAAVADISTRTAQWMWARWFLCGLLLLVVGYSLIRRNLSNQFWIDVIGVLAGVFLAIFAWIDQKRDVRLHPVGVPNTSSSPAPSRHRPRCLICGSGPEGLTRKDGLHIISVCEFRVERVCPNCQKAGGSFIHDDVQECELMHVCAICHDVRLIG